MNKYHNPENIPESAIPEGWMFIPKDKFPLNNWDKKIKCRAWLGTICVDQIFGEDCDMIGNELDITYIIEK